MTRPQNWKRGKRFIEIQTGSRAGEIIRASVGGGGLVCGGVVVGMGIRHGDGEGVLVGGRFGGFGTHYEERL